MAFRRDVLRRSGASTLIPGGRRRRGRLLATSRARAPDRIQPGGRGVASPAQHGRRLPAPAARIRQGRGTPVPAPPTPVQSPRTLPLARADLRRPRLAPVAAPTGGLRGSLRPRPLPDPLSAADGTRRLLAAHDRVERDGHPSPGGGPRLGRARVAGRAGPGRVGRPLPERRAPGPARPPRGLPAWSAPGGAAHLSGPAGPRLRAVSLARAGAHGR